MGWSSRCSYSGCVTELLDTLKLPCMKYISYNEQKYLFTGRFFSDVKANCRRSVAGKDSLDAKHRFVAPSLRPNSNNPIAKSLF